MRLNLGKRQKFLIAAILLLILLIGSRSPLVASVAWRFRVLAFTLVSFVVTVLALRDEDFSGIDWLMLPILPVFLSVSVLLVYPLLPREIYSLLFWRLDTDSGLLLAYLLKAVFLLIFALAFYGALLCANIFNVAAIRTIQLLRVAHSVGFFLTLLCALLFFTVIYSLHLSSLVILLAIFTVSFPLVLQSVWSLDLEPRLGREVASHSFTLSILLAEVSWALSFWPLPLFVFSLFLTAGLYAGLGVVQAHFGGRLNALQFRELGLLVLSFLLLTVVTSRWSG